MLFGLMPNAVWAEGTDTSGENEAKTYNFGMNISANEDPTEEIAEQEADSAVVNSQDEGDMSITLEETYEYEDWDEAGILAEEDVDYAVDGEGNYTIYTAAGLARVAYLTNNGFEQFLGKTVTLANDIDLTDAGVKGYSRDTVDETSSWNPIGSFKYTAATDSVDIKPFMGVFDGAGHKIKNLYMNVDEENTGLFGTVFTDMTIGGEQAVIRDVIIEGADIKCGFMTNSFLVGFLSETIITGCIVDETSVMTIKGNAQMNGGIVGGAQTSGLNLGGEIYIEDCVNNGTISGGMLTGGIAGATGQRIINCKNNGAISGISEIGGIVGYYQEEGGIAPFELIGCLNNGSVSAGDGWAGGIIGNTFISSETSLIARCYNTAEISASSMLGGIAGETTNANIENCYNTGKISGNNNANYAGGISGYFEATSSVSNCYNAGDIVNTKADKTGGIIGMNKEMAQNCFYLENTAEPETGGSVMITNEELADQTTFTDAGWDFEAVWTMSAELGRTVLQSVPEEYVPGAEQTQYLIHNEQELKEFRDNVNSGNTGIYARLVADIVLNDGIDMAELAADADGNVTYKGGAVPAEFTQWEPIGNSANAYIGTFDGNGYTISGLCINSPSENYKGLFGNIKTGVLISNLNVSGAVRGNMFVGGVSGCNYGSIINCHSSCVISGSTMIGGITGIGTGSIEECSNNGNIYSYSSNTDKMVGGIIGSNSTGARLINCVNNGSVKSENGEYNYIGGIAGINHNELKGCLNRGSVEANGSFDAIGGIVGSNIFSVSDCVNEGSITAISLDGAQYMTIGGGIVGSNTYIVSGCSSSGKIMGIGSKASAGGVAGLLA